MNQIPGPSATDSALMQRPQSIVKEAANQTKQEKPPKDRPITSDSMDTVELSDASKALAWLAEQHQNAVELQLPPEKLRKLAHG